MALYKIFQNFFIEFFVKFSIFSNSSSLVWYRLGSSTIILKGDHKCIPYPKFGSNWPFTGFFRIFLLIFLSNFLFLLTVAAMFDIGWGHQPKFLKGIINVSFTQSLVAIGHLQDFSECFLKFSIFSNSGGHVCWQLTSSTVILKGDHICIIYQKFGSNWPFTGFFRFFLLNFVKFSIFSNGDSHVWYRFGSSTKILKGDNKCIIYS